jgi:hypothetical protein
MKASSLSFCAAVCLATIGMLVGIIMAASGDHSVYPAHAHLNLLGWVSLFLIGIFYRFHPALDTSRIALTQAWVWICGSIVLSIGVAAIFLGHPELEVIAIIGSLIILADMVLFAYLVFRSEIAIAPRVTAAGAPAE